MTNLTIQEINSHLASLADGAPTGGETDPFLAEYELFLSRYLKRRDEPGQLLVVLGTGRNGSTSMARALRNIPNSLVTHELPPLVYWNNAGPRLAFHMEFMRISRQFFSIVGDVSHWWLPHFETMQRSLGRILLVYLHREFAATVASFTALKLRCSPPFNHWIPHFGDEWRNDAWDECYPTVSNANIVLDRDDEEYKRGVCRFCIGQYVKEYDLDARKLIQRHDGIELNLDDLFKTQSAQQLKTYLAHDFEWRATHLNRANTSDSAGTTPFNDGSFIRQQNI